MSTISIYLFIYLTYIYMFRDLNTTRKWGGGVMVFNVAFNNISAISCRSVLLV